MIVPLKNGKFQVKSHDGKKNLGTYSSRGAAEKRLAQVEMFKHIKKQS
jgi:hypothetical protein